MAVKYQCGKCGRRFVEWGAEKLGFVCPCAPDAELVRVGSAEDKAAKKPSLKRSVQRPAPARPIVVDPDEDHKQAPDGDGPTPDDVDNEMEVEDGEEILNEDLDDEEAEGLLEEEAEEEDAESAESLNLGDISGTLPAKTVEHADEEDWVS